MRDNAKVLVRQVGLPRIIIAGFFLLLLVAAGGFQMDLLQLCSDFLRRWGMYGVLVEKQYQKDNCSTKNEYIEKAIRFYSGYLDSERAEEYLPRVLAQVLEGKLDAFGKRIGRQMFKQAVDENLMANLVAFYFEMDEDMLQKLRVKCVKNVKETNGEIDFLDALRYQKGARG